ncbi:MAG: hypothetical protein IJU37_13130 [Desulfovibrio sp.]|nr:hypothetical protein [Desulfovibrio sp.]
MRKKFWLTAVLLCGLTAGACDNSGDEAPSADVSAPGKKVETAPPTPAATPQAAPAREKESLPPLAPAALERADRLVAFANAASLALSSGKYAQADVLAAFVEYYLSEWQLAKRPKIDARADAALADGLVPPAGLFTAEEVKHLAAHAQAMDKAIADMRTAYGELETYVLDANIRDEGARGRKLGARILKDHAAYKAARQAWLDIVEGLSAPAEQTLLRDHPLRRQIVAAESMFAVHSKVNALLAHAGGQSSALASLRQELQTLIAEAQKPPFRASPTVERLYRQFLREMSGYALELTRGLAEGFHNEVRMELNRAVLASRSAYNAFVRGANERGR